MKDLKISVASLPTAPFPILLEKYRSALEAGNRSPKTISWYLDILHAFHRFLQSENRMKPVKALGKADVQDYVIHLQQADRWSGDPHKSGMGKMSPFSVQGHVRALKAFFGWLEREQFIDDNPLAKMALPKVPKNMIKTLTTEQLKLLFNAIDRNTALGLRYYLALLLLLDTGARVSELVNIKLADIDFAKNTIKVMGKGQKERLLYFSPVTRKDLVKYTKTLVWSTGDEKTIYLLPGTGGGHLTINSVQQLLRRLALQAGLGGIKCTPHMFRHTFATAYLANGGSDVMLMTILGHADLQMTQKYVHLQSQEIQKQHTQCSPVAKLFPGKG